VNRYADFLQEPQVTATGTVAWLNQPGVQQAVPVPNVPGTVPATNGAARSTSPACGQHTREVLLENGFENAEIDALIARGVVGVAA
jgi:crotonobetainyl-CoA:carnitine CoA-transferase CaiB-like acyl-CoA transferase